MNGEYMKRYLLVLSLVTFAVLAVYVSAQEIAVRNSSLNGGFAPLSLTLSQPTRGVVFKTAAINSDGTVANCFRCVKATTIHLGTGAYQIAFDENVQATNGWSRFVQADTLTAGEENAWCNTADRAGNADAIFVNCQHEGGSGSQGNSVPVDTSFFIFVAR
jgi:hypothetical protein